MVVASLWEKSSECFEKQAKQTFMSLAMVKASATILEGFRRYATNFGRKVMDR